MQNISHVFSTIICYLMNSDKIPDGLWTSSGLVKESSGNYSDVLPHTTTRMLVPCCELSSFGKRR